MHILAIDDDPIVLDLLSGYLRKEDGFQLQCYASAEGALDALKTTEVAFDSILLDIMMPGINGIELCELLRETIRYRSIPILMITGSTEVDMMSRAFQAGATDFINKPLNPIELVARVRSSGLLNQSLVVARHSMEELTQLVKVRFEEPVSFKIDGMTEILALENQLLRYHTDCFAMSAFSLEISGLRGIYRSVKPIAYRACLKTLSETALLVLSNYSAKLAYVGNGRFVGVSLDRSRIDIKQLTRRYNENLSKIWASKETGIPVPPEGSFESISAQRIWSRHSASEQIRRCMDVSSGFQNLSISTENDLFAQFEKRSEHVE